MQSLKFDTVTLPNGLTIIGEHNPLAKSVAAGYFVRTGARDETDDIAGVSHFLEHMMFKGTARRSAEDINREFDELGASYNAYTSDEHTVYYAAALPERAAGLLDLLTDMMRPALREDDFTIEKNVILEEIAMYDDRPSFKVFEDGNRHYFNGHPLGNAVLGSIDSIRALEREQMLRYFEARYATDNLVLALAGNYDWNAVLEQIGFATTGWRASGATRGYPLLAPASGRRSDESPKLKRVHAAIYAPGVSSQDPRRYAAAILADCIGDDTGSRLYWALVDRGLVESASLGHHDSDQSGTFVGYVSSGPDELEGALEIFRAELERVQEGGVEADEWKRAQRKIATGVTLRGETPFGRLMSLGGSYLVNREYRSVAETVDEILSSRREDAEAILAERPFDGAFTYVLKPAAVPAGGSSHAAEE